MSSNKEFWAPIDLALDILGFNKNILEKRIKANYIKKETRNNVELVEISGEIERFGLSEDVARQKLDDYLNMDHGEAVGSIFESGVDTSQVAEAQNVEDAFDSAFIEEKAVASEEVPAKSYQAAPAAPIPAVIPAKDYSPDFDTIKSLLDEVKKIALAIPESTQSLAAPQAEGLSAEDLAPIVAEVSRLAALEQENVGYKQEISALNKQLNSAQADVAKLTSQCNQVMDELERGMKTRQEENNALKNLFKAEMADLQSTVSAKSSGGGGNGLLVVLLLVLMGAQGFLIYEFIQPQFTVLAKQNENINPLNKADIETVVRSQVDNLDARLSDRLNTIGDQLKTTTKENVAELNQSINRAQELNFEKAAKLINTLDEELKKQNKVIDGDVLKVLKSLEKELTALEKLVKHTLETTVRIKPGEAKFIQDSAE